MLLQTNSYIVPKDKRAEHARLLRRFRQVLARIGCDSFDVYEQVGSNWNTSEITGRVVQIMRFRDRRHQLAVQAAERSDPAAQAVIAEFCQLINFPYQQQQGLFAVGFYNSVLQGGAARGQEAHDASRAAHASAVAPAVPFGDAAVPVDVPETPQPPAGLLDPAPAADEPASPESPGDGLFADGGTEGIIAAAEQLSDDALDAGGDAAVADAIAATNGAAPVELAPHPHVELDPHRADVTDASVNGDAHDEDVDLGSLLDAHIDADSDPAKTAAAHTNGHARPEWAESLSLDGVLDDELAHDDRPLGQDGALDDGLDPRAEHNRNHVSH